MDEVEENIQDECRSYRTDALNAARDFHYGNDVEIAIMNATTESEIRRIMMNARHQKFNKDDK